MKMKDDRPAIPEVTSRQLFKLVEHIYPAEGASVEKLNGIFGKSKVANAAVTGMSIGVLVRKQSTISLTKEGQDLGKALASKNLEEQRKILKEVVLKNPVLEFIYSSVKEKKVLKNREIGQKISIQFNKNWKNELSYARYGTNCGDILAAAGLGSYINGIYSIEKIGTGDITESTSSPYLRYNKILRILSALAARDKELDELTTTLNTKKERLSYELLNCSDLNLVKKSGEVFSITKQGRDLINPLNTKEMQKNMFAEILRKSVYAKVIEIVEQNENIDRRKIGDILSHELRKEGVESTRYDWGKKFADWLNAAGIGHIEKCSKAKTKQSKVKKDHIKSVKPKSELSIQQKQPEGKPQIKFGQINQNIIFQIGRLIERIEIKDSVKQDITSDLKELIRMCETDVTFKAYVNLLNSHFTLYSDTKDFRIIKADLDFLKEKFGG